MSNFTFPGLPGMRQLWPEMPDEVSEQAVERLAALDLLGALKVVRDWDMSLRLKVTREWLGLANRSDDRNGLAYTVTDPDQLRGVPENSLYRSADDPSLVWMMFPADTGYHWLDVRSPGSAAWHTDEELPLPGIVWLPPRPKGTL